MLSGAACRIIPAGKPAEQAAATVEQGLEHVRTRANDVAQPNSSGFAGDVELRLKNDPEHAEALFREAIALSRKQAAQTWEIKATRSMKALFDSLGRQREIEDELAPILARFERSSRARRSSYLGCHDNVQTLRPWHGLA